MKLLNLCSMLMTRIVLITVVVLGLSACTKDLYEPPTGEGKIGEVTLDNYNDYATTKSVQLDIDYGKDCAQAYFEIYGENPLEVKDNQVVRRQGLIALASGFTDKNGVYNKKASITSSVSKVYVYSPDFGVPTLYITDITGGAIKAKVTFDNEFNISSMVNNTSSSTTRAALNTIKKNIPNVLGTWDSSAKPRYLVSDRKINVSEKLKGYITSYFPENEDNSGRFVADNADLIVTERANVWINYFGGTTGAQSVFAYYCYDKNATVDQIKTAARKACVIFPSAHSGALGGYSGVAVQLQYIGSNGKLQGDEFPADTKIGFLLWNNGWTNGNNGKFDDNVYYSTALLNRDGRSHTAVFGATDEGKTFNVITMEDWDDSDYNDVAFVIQSNPVKAIVVPPAAEPGDRTGTDSYRGLLGFEDNWPYQGDYDMNDMVLKYISNIEYNISNKVIGITDKFTLSWAGANFRSGFAYEVPFDLSKVKDVIVTGGDRYSINKNDNVITLFQDAKAELGVSGVDAKDMPNQTVKEVSYTVSITFDEPIVSKDIVISPYNPFIKKNSTEIHLTNMRPSKSADNVFDQSKSDISDGINTFFVCKDGYPFAIHLDARTDASVLNVNLKNEGVALDTTYPLFAPWALNPGSNIKWWEK